MLDHRVREDIGGEAEVTGGEAEVTSAEAHCRAQVQLKQFPHRQLPLLLSFLTDNLSDRARGGLLYVVPTSKPCKALLPESATRTLLLSTAQ